MAAIAASAGIAFFTSAECATSAWRVIAPMVTVLPSDLIPARSLMVPRSMMSEGEDEAQLHRLHQRLAAGQQLRLALDERRGGVRRWTDGGI